MTITCTIDSNPRAEVTWFKDGEMIVNASNNLVIHKSGLRNNLNLVALDEEDFGNYSCLAENKLGVVKDSVRISGMFFFLSLEYDNTLCVYSLSMLRKN